MRRVAVLKGFMQVQDATMKECKDKIVGLTARSMSRNVTISGLIGDNQEEKNCKTKVLEFIRDKLQMEITDRDVEIAHRIGGPPKADKPRLMVVRCSSSLRGKIFQYTKNLKDKTNEQGDYYNVKPQLPEPLQSERNNREEKMRTIRKANDLIPDEQKE